MKKDIKTNTKINLFLCEKYNSEELERWIEEDEDFAADVKLYERMEEEFGDKKKRALREELKQLGEQYFPTQEEFDKMDVDEEDSNLEALTEEEENQGKAKIRPLGYRFLQVAAACLMGVFVYKNVINPTQPPIPDNVLIASIDTRTTPQVQTAGRLINISEFLPPIITPSPEKSENDRTTIVPKINPLAFIANSLLDNMIGMFTRSRGSSYAIKIDTPLAETYPIVDGKILLKLAASIRVEEVLKSGDVILSIYNNRKKDYIKDRPQLRAPLTITQEKDKHYNTTFNSRLEFTPGLYYYMIEDKAGEDVLFAGKFTVGEAL